MIREISKSFTYARISDWRSIGPKRASYMTLPQETEEGNMKKILIFLVLIAIIFAVHAQTIGPSGTIELRPAEAAMEQLFNKGIGSPWVGGEPFSSSSTGSIVKDVKGVPATQATGITSKPLEPMAAEYRLVGTIDSPSGLQLSDPSSYNGTTMGISVSGLAGRYNVYEVYEDGIFKGLLFDKIA